MGKNGRPDESTATRSAPNERRELAELLATWEVIADPTLSETLVAVVAYRERLNSGAATLLERLLGQSESLLPVDILAEARRLVSASGSGSFSLGAAEQLIDRVAELLAPQIAARRSDLVAEFRAWTPHIDLDRAQQVLEFIWSSEKSATASEQVAALESLDRLEVLLRETRQQAAGEVGRMMDSDVGETVDREVLVRGRRALEDPDPNELLALKTALRDARERQARKRLELRLEESRRRLEALRHRIRQLADDLSAEVDAGGVHVLKSIDKLAEQCLLEADVGSIEILEGWSRSIEALLQMDLAPSEDLGRRRESLAEELRDRVAQGLRRDWKLEESERASVEAMAEATAQQLQGGQASGGPPFLKAVRRALELLRSMERRQFQRVQEAAESLRRSEHRLDDLLRKKWAEVPTAQVVQARIWLEQVDGVLAGGDISGIQSLDRAIEEDVLQLQQTVARLQKRRRNREESERDVILQEIDHLRSLAQPRMARRLSMIENRVETANSRDLLRISDIVRQEGSSIERQHRRVARELLRKAERWLGRSEKHPRRERSEVGRELAQAAAKLVGDLEGDDVAAIVDQTDQLRSALCRASPLQRAGLRWALAFAVAVLMILGLSIGVYMWNRPRDVTVRLSSIPSRPVAIRLIRGDESVYSGETDTSDAVIRGLEDGTYDVYLDERFTGVVIRVPGDDEVTVGARTENPKTGEGWP